MAASKEDKKFEQVVQKIDPQSKLLRTWKLTGGVSAQVTAFEIERLYGQFLKLPDGASTTSLKKPCEIDIDGLLPRPSKSSPFTERDACRPYFCPLQALAGCLKVS